MNEFIKRVDEMIKDSMKNHLKEKTNTYRLLKSALLLKQTEENAKPIDEEIYISVIKKMVKQRKDSIVSYKEAGRQDLVSGEETELEILNELLPKEASSEDIEKVLLGEYPDLVIPKSDMGKAIGLVKKNLKNVDGKLIADIVKSHLG